ncbi:MAG: tetratricopeptide repeat protein [Cyanobacteria bacterium REEB67]|nr:tetratricopeptide repeat protein [Cyanobacteria bacterium REEB67]
MAASDANLDELETRPLESRFEVVFSRARTSGEFENYAEAADDYAEAATMARDFGEGDVRLLESVSRLAYCRYRLGELAQAEASYREALSLMERFHTTTHPERFASIIWALAVTLSDERRFDEAEKFFRRSMEISENWGGPKDRFVADCLWGLSKCLTANGKVKEAETCIRRAISIYETLPDCFSYLGTNYANLGEIVIQQGRYADGVPILEKAIKLKQQYGGAYDSSIVSLTSKIALALIQLKRYKEAQTHLKTALKIISALYGERHIETARRHIAIGNCLNNENKYTQAQKPLTTAYEILREQTNEDAAAIQAKPGTRSVNSEPTLLAACLFELTTVYNKLGEKKKYKGALEELVDLYQHSNLPRASLYADTLIKLGSVHDEACQYRKAKEYFEKALLIRESLFGLEHKLVAECLMRISSCASHMNKHKEAHDLQMRAENMLAMLKHRA